MNTTTDNNFLCKLRNFYMSYGYPPVICLVVLLGGITGLEVYFNTVTVILTVTGLIICDSIKPFIVSLCTTIMQISVVNSPFYPSRSDYYFTGWRLPYLIVMAAAVIGALLYFSVKNRLYFKISFKKVPHFIPLLVFSAALMLNGFFSSSWVGWNLVFGLGNVIVYLVLYLLMYTGFSDDDSPLELSKYFAYISALIALVITGELVHLFLTSDEIFIDGAINKVGVALGWGIWNLVGVSLAILIPVIFYGMHKNKYPWLYFAAATVAYIASVLTMSRNALIFSSLTYAACIIISCFVGKNKRIFRIITLAGILAVAVGAIVLWDKIYALLGDYFERGLSDNGRFAMWREAFNNFLEAPIFGKGFYGLTVDGHYVFGPLPTMAHNTVLQLLSSMGLVGLLAYGYYVFCIFKPMFKKPTFLKTMLYVSILVLMLESLLDNFIFNIYPLFYYSTAFAIIVKSDNSALSE